MGVRLVFFVAESNQTSVAAMEIVEGITQPKITPKRIKVEEIVEEEEEDRISALPYRLLLEILSRLPDTESAIRTGTLSKRWKYVWTSVPTLIFRHLHLYDKRKRPLSDFVSFVDETLAECRQPKLRKFAVHTTYDIQFESQFNKWIRYAISCNVEELDLSLSEAEFVLNEYFFINSCFTDLKLQGCIFNPTGAIRWNRLRSLYISEVNLDEDLIENILSGSPLLETLELSYCYGYERLDITSKSVKKLVFSGYSGSEYNLDLADIIEINAPNILSLTIRGDLFLWKLLLLNVSSLIEATLNFSKGGHRDETTTAEAEVEMLKGFIRSLLHVKELKIGDYCCKDVNNYDSDYDSDTHPPIDTKLLEQSIRESCSNGRSYAGSTSKEVQQLKEKVQKMENEQAEQEAQDAQRDARMKEMEDKLKALEELLLRFPAPPPT